GGRNGQHQSGEAADGEQDDEGHREQHGRLESQRPAEHGGRPVEHLHPGGHRDQHGGVHEEQLAGQRDANGEHVMRPYRKRQEGDRPGGVDHGGIAEQRLATERGDDHAHGAEGRQDHDVHLGVAEEPEHMLEQHRVTAAGGIEETGTEVDIHQHHGYHTRQYRHYRDQQEGGDQPGPDEQRHLHQGHAGGAQVEDGGDDVDRAHDRTDTRQVDGEDEEGGAVRPVGGGQRRIEGPAEVGRAALHEQGRDQQPEGRWQQPETEVVHARQRHVRRTDHQRYHHVGQPDTGRHHRAEHHDQAVHGGHLVEELRLHQLQAGLEQLGADDHRQGAAEQEHGEAEPQVHRADILVVGGQYPAHRALGR